MLDLLRKKSQSLFIQATIIVIALVFILWGGNAMRGNRANVVAMVDDTPVSLEEFRQLYNKTLAERRQQFGGNLPEELLNNLVSKQQVLEQLIQRILLRKGAREMGVFVSDEEARRTVRDMEAFRENGSFNVQRYQEVLANARLTPTDYEAGVKSDLLTQKTLNLVSSFAKITPESLAERFNYDFEEVTADYVALTADDFKEKVTFNDKDLQTFFEANKERYKTLPQIELEYISFPFAAQGADTITEDDIRIYYQQNQASYVVPEKRKARHILIRVAESADADTIMKKREEAEAILQKARQGQDFAKLAKQYSEDKSAAQGGDLGFFERGQMVKPFEDAAFTLKEGQISDLVRSQFGFHIIKVEKVQPGHTKTLAEVSDEIRQTLAKEKGKSLAFKKANAAYEKIILAGSLEKYASSENIGLEKTGFFTRKSVPPTFANEQSFISTAFNLKKGELSSIIELSKEFAILFVDDAKEPEVPPFESVKGRVEQDFIAEHARELAKDGAEAMLAKLKNGGDFGKEASEFGVSIQKTPPLTRANPQSAGLPSQVVEASFSLSKNAPYPESVITADNAYYVLKLESRKEPAPELLATKKPTIERQLKQENQMMMLASWLDNLKANTEITINQQLLQ